MARKRMPMELIRKKKARLSSFEKRKKSLKNSAYELSTLCGVSIGMIVCNDNRNDAEVWPPSPDPIARMRQLYTSQDGMCNRTYGVSDYFEEKRERVEEQIKKMREGKYAKWEEECKSFSEDQWRDLGHFLKAKIGAVREKITSVLNNRLSGPDLGQPQQHWAYFGTQDYMGSLEGSTNLCPETKFWLNPLMQERVSVMPDFIQDHQILAYNDTYENLGDLVEGSRNPYLESEFIMTPYLQESEIYMPEIARQHQNLALYEARNSIGNGNEKVMAMDSDGASCSEGIDSYTYFLNHNCCQKWGMQTDMMEKVDMREVEPLMSYHMPNEETMLQSRQGLMSMSAFPEMHQNWGMQKEMMGKVGIREDEPLMSYHMPNKETMLQNWQGLMSMSAFSEMQTTMQGYYVRE